VTDAPGPPYELNIGAGKTYIPGFVNVDISDRADVTLDLSKDPLPFADDSVSTVFSAATLEHIPEYLFALKEIHRVLRHDGELLLKLPYVTLTEAHLINPYHLHNFSERSFSFFDPLEFKGSAAEISSIAFRKVFVRYSYIGYFALLPRPMRVWARRHLFNVVRQFDIGLVALKRPGKVDVSRSRARSLEARMTELADSRTRYGQGRYVPPASRSRLRRVAQRRWQIRHR
jgi:SAM-dependent methyltransferase